MIKISMIVACTIDGGIGNNNSMAWHIPEEMRKFKKITVGNNTGGSQNAVIMGRKTWESLGRKALPNRLNIILSRRLDVQSYENLVIRKSLLDCLIVCQKKQIQNIFIIGGAELYNYTLENYSNNIQPFVLDKVYLSVMYYNKDHQTDTYFDIHSVFENFDIEKDKEYDQESKDRLFASYICSNKYV